MQAEGQQQQASQPEAGAAKSSALTPAQSNVLFDILTHKAVYAEICAFKKPDAIRTYGEPFQTDTKSTSPLLQTLVRNFALTLPGLRDVAPDFWRVRVASIIESLAAAELSESYDKGVLGIRKTVATAISAVIEYPVRGCIGGFPRDKEALERREYNAKRPEDVLAAFHAFLQQLVYGDLWTQLFKKTAETDKLTDQSSLVQSAHEFILVNLASFMHYALVLSPEGPSILRMVEAVHKLAPYMLIRQTLRVGNVATMINGMVKLLLAKMSVGSIMNWVGWSKDADEGMNLLQSIISTVLGFDKRELRKRIDKVEKDKDAPPKEVRKILDAWTTASREEHEECRSRSQDQNMSIVAVILSLSPSSVDMTEAQHSKALEYLALQLGVRDRKEIVQVLCHSNPDHLTQAIRDGVTAYEPIIRQVHQAVDLSQTVWDFEVFMNDMIKMSKPGKTGQAPSVEDYVKLLHDHMSSTHRFLHQVAKNGEEVTGWFKEYCIMASKHFQRKGEDNSSKIQLAVELEFGKLSAQQQEEIKVELDEFSAYKDALHASSASRIKEVLGQKSSTAYGPGAYLARWQELLDSTPITPYKDHAAVRRGGNDVVKGEARKDVDGGVLDSGVSAQEANKLVDERTPDAPTVDRTLEVMGPKFRNILLEQTSASSGLQV